MSVADDKLAIMELCALYSELVDSKQIDHLVEEVFAEDATVDLGFGPVEGSAAIADFYKPLVEVFEATAHSIGTFIIDVDGDIAKGTLRVTAWHWINELKMLGKDRSVDLAVVARYSDEYRRTPHGWRISKRNVGICGPGGVAVGRQPEAWPPPLDGS